MNKFVILYFIASIACSLGQESNQVPPGNPTQFPSGDMKWSVEFTYEAKPGGSANGTNSSTQRYMKSMEVTQIGNVQRKLVTWSDNKIQEDWHFPAVHFTITTASADGSPVCLADSNRVGGMLLRTGFDTSSFSWINAGDFKGITSYQGTSCYHYKGTIPVQIDFEGHSSQGNVEAWLDKKTLFPVALDDGAKLGVFTFDKVAPKGPLTPPKAIQDAYLDNAPPPGPWAK